MSEGRPVLLIGAFAPAERAHVALSAALLRGLVAGGHAVTTAALAGQGRAEVMLARCPMYVPDRLKALAPATVIWVESGDPADVTPRTWEDWVKSSHFAYALGRLGGTLRRVRVGGARAGRGTLWVARDAAPGAAALAILVDLGLAQPGAAWAEPAPQGGDVALIEAVARLHDFRHFKQIARLAAPGIVAAPLRNAAQGPRSAIANAPDPDHATAAVPVSRYMAYVRACRGGGGDLADAWEAFRFARWYATEAPQTQRGHTAPIAPELAAWLGRDAFDPWSGRARASRLIAAEAAGRDDLLAAGRERALARWWVLDHAGPRQYAAALTPDALVAHLADPEPGDRGAPFALGSLLAELHRGSETYRTAYDIAAPVGRIAFVFDLMLHLFDSGTRRRIFDGAPVDWLAGRLDGRSGCLSRFEYLVALYAGPEPAGVAEVADPTRSPGVRRWFRDVVCAVYPDFAVFATEPEAEALARDRSLDVVGLSGSDTGLGANLWMSEAALAAARIAPRIRDSEAGFAPVPGRSAVAAPLPLARKAVLIHLNADVVPQVLCHPLYDRHRDLTAIGFLLWELETLPASHRLGLDLLDEVWVPTRFLVDVYAPATRAPVVWVGKGIALPPVTPLDLRRFGVPRGAFVFLLSFDFHSSVERKNPLATVRAFGLAFAGVRDVVLVVKTTEVVRGHWGDPNGQWSAIAAAAAADPRIVIVTDKMPMGDFLGLIAAADCVVTSHRAEGFGYLPAYGLILGRPVIATDYSGSADFITPQTGFPVAWTPRPVAPGETIHPLPGAFWADVAPEDLAVAMRAVHDDPAAAAARARAGQALMAGTYSVAAQAARYRARLAALGLIEAGGADAGLADAGLAPAGLADAGVAGGARADGVRAARGSGAP